MMRRFNLKTIALLLCLGLLFLFNAGNSLGANFPEKPIKIMIAFPAGSGIDSEVRGTTPYLQKHLGVRVIIENIPGADGKIGLTKLWKMKPDGYNLIMQTTTMSLIGEFMLNPEYRMLDFSYIYSWSQTNQVLVVNSETYKTFGEFIKAAKSQLLSAGIPGRGSTGHLCLLMMMEEMGIKVNWVPFDGAGGALTALAGKHIDFAVTSTTTALPLVKAGKLKPLMVLANGRDSVFPDAPMPKDLGYNIEAVPLIRGMNGPPKMDGNVIKILEDAFSKVVKEPEYLAWAKLRMMDIVPLRHEEYRKAIEKQRKEIEKHKNMLKS